MKRLSAVVAPVLIAIALLAGLEFALRIFHYGPSRDLLVIRPAGDEARWNFNRTGFLQFYRLPHIYATNPGYVNATIEKGDKKRIVILGGSVAYGIPNPAFGFAAHLEAFFQVTNPDIPVEIINLAYPGMNSGPMRLAFEQSLELEPDAVIYYEAVNELCQSIEDTSGQWWTRSLGALEHSRLLAASQDLVAPFQSPGTGVSQQAMLDMFQRWNDPEYVRRTLPWFESNLSHMMQSCNDRKIPFLLCSFAHNDANPDSWYDSNDVPEALVDGRYEASLREAYAKERAGDFSAAIEAYQAAAQLAPRSAIPWMRMSLCAGNLGQEAVAAKYAGEAYRLSAFTPFIDAVNASIVSLASAKTQPYTHFVNIRAALQDESPLGILGEKHMYDSVHLSPRGNYLVARELHAALSPLLNAPERPTPAEEDIERFLDMSPQLKKNFLLELSQSSGNDAPTGYFISDAILQRIIYEQYAQDYPLDSTSPWVATPLEQVPIQSFTYLSRRLRALNDATASEESLAATSESLLADFQRHTLVLKAVANAYAQAGESAMAVPLLQEAAHLPDAEIDVTLLMQISDFSAASGDRATAAVALESAEAILERPSSRPYQWKILPLRDAVQELRTRLDQSQR